MGPQGVEGLLHRGTVGSEVIPSTPAFSPPLNPTSHRAHTPATTPAPGSQGINLTLPYGCAAPAGGSSNWFQTLMLIRLLPCGQAQLSPSSPRTSV